MKFLLPSLCLLLLPALATAEETAEPQLTPYVSAYSMAWSGNTLGEGSISLAPHTEKDCYRFESRTTPIAPVRWLYGSPRETSLFCIKDGQIRARSFEYHNDKREKDNFTLDFDWVSNKVKSLKRGEMAQRELPGPAYDRFVIQQAVRLWARQHAEDPAPAAEFVMVDDDRIVTYRFAITGRETIEVPAGRFETLRIERVGDPHKSMRSWLALERDFLPVRIERIEDGEVKLRMLLK